MQHPCFRVVEERGKETLSEVTHGWMFIFRAVNYLTKALAVPAYVRAESMCVSVQESGRCGPLSPTYRRVHTEASECREEKK